MKVQLDLCNYTTKADLKKTVGLDTSNEVDLDLYIKHHDEKNSSNIIAKIIVRIDNT